MASEIRKDRVFGMFKPPRRERGGKRKINKRENMDTRHLDMIRRLPCCLCGRAADHAHHLKEGTKARGAGMRATDNFAVPVCWQCHEEVERLGSRNERAHFSARGIDSLDLAAALWAARGNQEAMQRVVAAHLLGG